MSGSIQIEVQVNLDTTSRGRKVLQEGPGPAALPVGRVPRVARLLALAHRMEGLIRSGEVRDQAELARLGQVSRARITQVMNLLLLAPDVQEEILFLPLTRAGRDPIRLADLQPIALALDWTEQRRLWRELLARTAWAERGNG